jgi:molecular chaperone GrpE
MTEDHVPTEDWDADLKKLVDDGFGAAPASAMTPTSPAPASTAAEAEPSAEALLAERTADLQRVQAEYANYKKRVDRDRLLARQSGIEAVLGDLLPVLDAIEAARAHDELTGGTKLLADELEKIAAKYGLEAFGAADEPFDPHVHEALMQVDRPGYAVTSVAQVFQSGYRLKDRVLRPARVAVAEPTEEETLDGLVAEGEPVGDSPHGPVTEGDADAELGRGDCPHTEAEAEDVTQTADVPEPTAADVTETATPKPPRPPKPPKAPGAAA